MIRSVRMAEADARILELAARYIGTLAAVERSHALGDDEGVTIILGGVDPVDLMMVRAHLNELWALFNRSPVRIGGEPTAAGESQTRSPLSPAAAASDGRPSPPSYLHPTEITPESRRV